jgi:hypothetical protein
MFIIGWVGMLQYLLVLVLSLFNKQQIKAIGKYIIQSVNEENEEKKGEQEEERKEEEKSRK